MKFLVHGGCCAAGEDTGEAADEGEQDRLGEELRPDLGLGRAEGAAEADLGAAFEDGDDHDVGDADGSDDQRFMNAEIFNVLHRAALVVVDLTAMRTNCLMELGYALGRRRRFVISAQDGANLGFDLDKRRPTSGGTPAPSTSAVPNTATGSTFTRISRLSSIES